MVGRARALRALLTEAVQGCSDRVLDRLGPFASWTALAALHDSGWLGPEKASARANAAQIRRRLREIADARRPIADARPGAPLMVAGTIVAVTELDLLVDDGSGEVAHVRARDVRWLRRVTPLPGNRVTVLGIADSEVDTTRAPTAPRRLPRRVVIRAVGLPVIAHLGTLAIPTRAR